MKKMLIDIAAFVFFGIALAPAYAADAHQHQAEGQKTYIAKGEIVSVDKAASKVKMNHEAVPALNWPAMTMFFPVADKSQLDALNVGDQVEFEFVSAKGGRPTITRIKPLK